MAIKVSDLEERIRTLAGEVEILRLRERGYLDDIAQLKIPAKEVSSGEQRNPKRGNR